MIEVEIYGAKFPLIVWILLAITLFTQATWLFVDARRRGRFPWLWGVWGLTHFPTPLLVYLIITRYFPRRRKL